ncbi:SusC/RagA family TonB-linked outer membrane protein [Parapedobacter tibetensis]|uniref:SusC/RagA family TonB-linked outer membrane protein n=1 Tax=Parapedobacter tibetensis TaxID=2972951 RepID=UPI00214D501F|nr:SusC/RagA family TonB-linked outer membrane protein [Parapedobacter tibetensis]
MKQKLLCFLVLGLVLMGSAYAQDRRISGRVTSEIDGGALSGVSVLIIGSGGGTQTDENGQYSLIVPAAARNIQFRMIGFVTQTLEIDGRNTVNVALTAEKSELAEVIITGYTETARTKNVGASVTISSDKIQDVPMPNFSQRLQGLAAGVSVLSGSGQPGTNAVIRIRGQNSIAGGETPLYVVDGVPIDEATFSTMNPNDFESISILKDASTTALYGSRGGNGVVVIKTKRGKAGGLQLRYNTQFGIDNRATSKFDMMSTSELLALQEQGRAGIGWTLSPNNTSSSIEPIRRAAILDSISRINTNWEDLFFRTGRLQTHEVTASGGDENTRYFSSLNYYDQDGVAYRSDLRRYTFRLNLDHNSGPWEFGLQSNAGWSKSNFIESEAAVALANPYAAIYLGLPWENPFGPDGRIITSNNTTNGFSPANPFNSRYGVLADSRIASNTLDRMDNTTLFTDQIKTMFNANAAYRLYDGLKLSTNVGLDYRQTTQERSIYPGSHAGVSVQNGNQGSYGNNVTRRLNLISTTGLSYNKVFADKHDLSVHAMFEAVRWRESGFNYTGYGINPKLLNTPAGITAGTNTNAMIPGVGGGKTEYGLLSYFGIANYTYDRKYTFQGSFRRDGSSKLPTANRWRSFYSLGGNWNISEETFLQNSPFVNQLILRASYGLTATAQNQSNFGYLPTYSNASYAGESGIAPATPGNPDFDWEYTRAFNIGLDYGLWNNRVRGALEFYHSTTRNLFISQQLSMTSGFNSLSINAGNMLNQGIEFDFAVDVLSGKDYVWTINANIAYNRNEITSLGQEEEYPQGTSIIRVGLPRGSHYAVGYAGADPETGAPLYYNRNQETGEMDGTTTTTYDGNTMSVAQWGTMFPPTKGGFGTSFSYKGFSFSTLFVFFEGFHLFNNESFFLASTSNFSAYNQQKRMANAWNEPGQITDIARLGSQRQFSSFDIEDASFIRWRNVTVSYRLPTDFVRQSKFLSGVRVYAMGQNLMTWTKWSGFDPENSINIHNFRYPAPKNFTFGVEVNF